MNNILIFALTAFATLLAILFIRFLFPKIGLLDKPEKYGYARKPVPYPAGIIIPILFFAVIFFLVDQSSALFKPMCGFFIASVLLVVTSFIDDIKNLSPKLRLFIQFIAAGIVVASGVGIEEIRLPFAESLMLNTWSFEILGHSFVLLADLLAIFWMIGLINAMNWLDGISGLTSSVSAIATAVLAATAYSFGQPDVAILFAVLSIICFVFFLFDLESPKILMGDSGSMFLGFALAVFTIIAGGKIATLMIVFFVPLFDAVWTIGRRMAKGVSPLKGDLGHLHHKLLDKIKNRKNTVLLYAFVTCIFGVSAFFLETFGKFILLSFLTVFLVFVELKLEK